MDNLWGNELWEKTLHPGKDCREVPWLLPANETYRLLLDRLNIVLVGLYPGPATPVEIWKHLGISHRTKIIEKFVSNAMHWRRYNSCSYFNLHNKSVVKKMLVLRTLTGSNASLRFIFYPTFYFFGVEQEDYHKHWVEKNFQPYWFFSKPWVNCEFEQRWYNANLKKKIKKEWFYFVFRLAPN